MVTLKGTVHKNGSIEFNKEDNPWAFQRMDDGLKSGQENRIVFRPEMAPIELQTAPGIDETDVPWIDRARMLLSTADKIYLQKTTDHLLFRQAFHETDASQYLITLGMQKEIDDYATKHWKQGTFLYATKYDGFRFDMTTFTVDGKAEISATDRKVEIVARIVASQNSAATLSLPTLTFDATGSLASVDVVAWRSTVKDGELARFHQENSFIVLTSPDTYREPFTFCHDHRKTQDKHTYTFAGEKLEKRLKKVIRKDIALKKSAARNAAK